MIIDDEHPVTAEVWWRLANDHRQELSELLRRFHPFYGRREPLPITAPRVEQLAETYRKELRSVDPRPHFEGCFVNQNPFLADLLNEGWIGIPESLAAHSLPGFGVLCDLCSEA